MYILRNLCGKYTLYSPQEMRRISSLISAISAKGVQGYIETSKAKDDLQVYTTRLMVRSLTEPGKVRD
jgi:hypothetical protein